MQTTDDLVYRFQPRLIEVRGVVMWAAFRYIVLWVFTLLAVPTFVVAYWLLDLRFMNAAVAVAAVAGGGTYRVQAFMAGDRTFKGLLGEWRSEITVWWAQRTAAARLTATDQPYRYRASRVRYSTGDPTGHADH